MLEHIDKVGRVRKTHGGHGDLRQIQRMELTGTRHASGLDPRCALCACGGPADRQAPQASTACTPTPAAAPRGA
jgi:hypothetical protein